MNNNFSIDLMSESQTTEMICNIKEKIMSKKEFYRKKWNTKAEQYSGPNFVKELMKKEWFMHELNEQRIQRKFGESRWTKISYDAKADNYQHHTNADVKIGWLYNSHSMLTRAKKAKK